MNVDKKTKHLVTNLVKKYDNHLPEVQQMDVELKELLGLSAKRDKMYAKFTKSDNSRQSSTQQEAMVKVSEMNDTEVK